MKKRFGLILLSSLLVMLPSCQNQFKDNSSSPLVSDTSRANDEVNQEIYAIYEKAKNAGYTGTYEEWLASIKGEKGDKGDPGKDGTSLRTGKGVPVSSLGSDGDSYIDTDSWDYYVKENGAWTKIGNIKGADGKNGGSSTNPDTTFTVTFDANGGTMPQGSTNSVSVTWGDCITLPEPSKDGVFFDGWYTSEGKRWYSTDAVFSDLSLKARWNTGYAVTATSESPKKGTTTGSGNYKSGSNVTVTATPSAGYSFDGWWKGETKVSSSVSYSFTIGNEDVELTARFTPVSYAITYVLNGGTNNVKNPMSYTVEDSLSLYNPTRNGYTFSGWYDSNGRRYTAIAEGTTGDLVLTAKWTEATYKITYSLDGGTNNPDNPTGYGTDSEDIVLKDPTKYGYDFAGWYDADGNKVTTIRKGSSGNITLTAMWSIASFQLTVLSEDATKGTVTGSGTYKYQSSVTVTAAPATGYYFGGWYNGDEKVWKSASYTFSMVGEDTTLTAKWLDGKEKGFPDFYGKETYQFGSYPQSKVTDTTVTAKLDALAGTPASHPENVSWKSFRYYTSGVMTSSNMYVDVTYADEKYRGIYINSYRPSFTSNDSTSDNSHQDDNGYSLSTVYWFKFEPITWKVLDVDWKNSKAFLCSDTLLDSMDYYYSKSNRTVNNETIYPNNYEYSHIRYWLNGYASDSYVDNNYSFYDTAFSDTEKNKILTTTVDNSVASTGDDSNPYACEDTSDKLFLLSYKEIMDGRYGFVSNSDRVRKGSDYAKSQGLYESVGNSYYWLRSPRDYYHDVYDARRVYDGGSVDYNDYVDSTNNGVSPALWVNL